MNAALAPAVSDQQETLEAVDLALQMGELLLRSGASTGRVVKVMRDLLATLGEESAGVALTPEQMTVAGAVGAVPFTVTRVSPRIAWQITRVA